ncbi:MAG TPA: indole-3-glycerol phosphate synthase TrpC [Chitinispirillaceae bacterium]|nr:indole-3-glycerol phosphate synthase TrpC [Chitinispirillaceae bacterium]
MHSVLVKIVEQKKIEVDQLKKTGFFRNERATGKRDFIKALNKLPELAIISEVKKASPSKGVIRADFDPVAIAQQYQEGGASAISVLTDEKFFQGHYTYLQDVRAKTTLPVLRKDFIIDPLQVEQTAAIGADAMLLIAAILEDSQMKDLYEMTLEKGIVPLIEIHTPWELDRVMKIEPSLIGINNRNLDTFETTLDTTFSIVKYIPKEITVVSESGIENVDQARKLRDAGVKALLVGESLMRLDDPKVLINELRCKEQS